MAGEGGGGSSHQRKFLTGSILVTMCVLGLLAVLNITLAFLKFRSGSNDKNLNE